MLGYVDTLNAAYTSQKEQNYLWLPFHLLIKCNLSLFGFENWQNVVSAISGYKFS